MALDTRAKRASVIGLSFYPGFSVHPDEIKGQEWRQSVGYGYSGNLVEGIPDTNIYVAGESGSDVTGDGTAEKPFKTMAPFTEIYGDTVHFQENCPFQINVVSGATYQQWSGQTQAVIDGEAARAYCIRADTKTDFTIDRLHCTDSTSHGFYSTSANGTVSLLDVKVYSCGAAGIRFSYISSLTLSIDNCESYLNNGANFYIHSMSGGTVNITNCKGYTSNNLYGCHLQSIIGGTINITNSDFYSNDDNGIYIQTISGTTNITVSGCNCYSQTTLHGIYVTGVTGGTIALTNNNCYSNDDHGIYILTVSAGTVTVDGNACYLNTQRGLYIYTVTGGDFDLKRNTVRDNTQHGIYLREITAADSFLCQFNLVYSNGAAYQGIYLVNADDISIYRCTVVDENHGIYLAATSTGCDVDGCIVANSTIGIVGAVGSGPTIDYTCLYNNGTQTTDDATVAFAAGTGNITTDPQFTDTATDDYTLEDDSPCKEGGIYLAFSSPIDLAGVPSFVDGESDIGCFEVYRPIGVLTTRPQESLASIGFIPGGLEQLGSRGFIQTGYEMDYRIFGSQLDLADESNRINLLTRSDQMKYLLTDYLIGAIDG